MTRLNFKEGFRRFGVITGLVGFLLGAYFSFKDFSLYSEYKRDHARFEMMTSTIPSLRQVVHHANDDLAHGRIPSVAVSPRKRADGAPNSASNKLFSADYKRFLNNSAFNSLPDADQQQILSNKLDRRLATLDAGDYRIWRHLAKVRLGLPALDGINYSVPVGSDGIGSLSVSDNRISSITLSSGEVLYNHPLPSVWDYGGDIIVTFVGFGVGYAAGFLVPWWAISCLSWLLGGFCKQSEIARTDLE